MKLGLLKNYYLVNCYTPNSKRGLERLEYRQKWEDDFREYLIELDKKKPVILCGDLNVAHKEIDLKNPKTNTKNPGFTPEEREKYIADTLCDTITYTKEIIKNVYIKKKRKQRGI